MQRDHSPGFNTTSTDSSSSNLYLNQSVQQHSVLSPPIPQIEYIQSYQNSSQALIPHQQQQQHLQHQNNQQNYSTNSNSSSNSAITSTYANDYNFTQQEQLYSVDSPQPLSPRKGKQLPFNLFTSQFFLVSIVALLLLCLRFCLNLCDR